MISHISYKHNLWVSVLLFLLCVFLFSPTFSHPFMMDDKALIVRNKALFDPGSFQIDCFTPYEAHLKGQTYVYFRPVTQILNALPAYLFGKDPLVYRVFSLLLFYLACISVYELIFFLFEKVSLAIITAGLFCLHPINGVLVNYITASGYSVLIITINLAVIGFFIGQDRKQKRYSFLTVFLILVALSCHEIAIAFPLYLGAVLYFVRREKLTRTIRLCIPYIIIMMGYYIFRQYYAPYQISFGERLAFMRMSFVEYTAAFSQCIFWYAKALLFLDDIVLMWTPPNIHQDILLWNMALIIIAAVFLYLIFSKKRTEYAFGLSWLSIGLLPVALACISRPSFGAIIEPHWLFFSTIGFCIVVSGLLLKLFKQASKILGAVAIALILISYCLSTMQYNYLWKDEKRYCAYMTDISPEILSCFWLADVYLVEKNFSVAKHYYEKTIRGYKSDWQAYTNLGLIEDQLGNQEKAKRLYQKALKLMPKASDPKNNLAAIYIEEGRNKKAEKLLLEVVQDDFYAINARKNLFLLYTKEGLKEKAKAILDQIERINPSDPHILSWRAMVERIKE